jgi:hypothetical protein
MPPDMALRAPPAISIAERIAAAEDAGEISAHEAMEAETMLSHLNVAKAGRLPLNQVMNGLRDQTSQNVRELFGLQTVPARLRLSA